MSEIEKLKHLVEEASCSVGAGSAENTVELEKLQKLLDEIGECVSGVSGLPEEIKDQAKEAAGSAGELISAVMNKEISDVDDSIRAISNTILTLSSLSDRIVEVCSPQQDSRGQTVCESEQDCSENNEPVKDSAVVEEQAEVQKEAVEQAVSEQPGETAEIKPAEDEIIEEAVSTEQAQTEEASSEDAEATIVGEDDLPLVMDFIAEAAEHIENAEAGLLQVESNPEDAEAINMIFRGFHTVKGMAGFLNLTEIGSLAHAAENLLDMGRKGTVKLVGDVMNVIFESVDLLKRMMEELQEAVNGSCVVPANPELGPLLKKLHAVTENGGSAGGSETASTEPAQSAEAVEQAAAESEPQAESAVPETTAEESAQQPAQQTVDAEQQQETVDAGTVNTAGDNKTEPHVKPEVKPESEEPEQAAQEDTETKQEAPCAEVAETKGETKTASEPKENPVKEQQVEIEPKAETKQQPAADTVVKEQAENQPKAPEPKPEPKPESRPVEPKAEPAKQPETKPQQKPAEAPAAASATKQGQPAEATKTQQPANSAPAKQSMQAAKHQKPVSDEKIKVSTQRLDELVNMVGELVIAQSMVSQTVNNRSRENDDVNDEQKHALGAKINHQGKIVRELQELSMMMRMVPIAGVFQKMARLVRDLSQKSGKKVDLVTEGEDTELDRIVVDQIADPLVHMIRNSVDHGIESAEDRLAAGKNEAGRVELRAYHQAGNIVIEIVDDGKGLDRQKILKKAVDNGLVSQAEADSMSDSDVYKLIFSAGLSTAAKITEVSGRGVGMDVVKKNIESLRGKVDIESEFGKGTRFLVRLPLTMAIIDGQIVRIGKERYIIPIVSIECCIRPTEKSINTVAERGEMAMVHGELVPMVRLYKMFGVKPDSEKPHEASLVVVEEDGKRGSLMVDELLGQQQVVIKSLGEGIGRVPGISGGAIMGDGRVSLIIDVPSLLEAAWK